MCVPINEAFKVTVLRGKAGRSMWERKSTAFAGMTGFHCEVELNSVLQEKEIQP